MTTGRDHNTWSWWAHPPKGASRHRRTVVIGLIVALGGLARLAFAPSLSSGTIALVGMGLALDGIAEGVLPVHRVTTAFWFRIAARALLVGACVLVVLPFIPAFG